MSTKYYKRDIYDPDYRLTDLRNIDSFKTQFYSIPDLTGGLNYDTKLDMAIAYEKEESEYKTLWYHIKSLNDIIYITNLEEKNLYLKEIAENLKYIKIVKKPEFILYHWT